MKPRDKPKRRKRRPLLWIVLALALLLAGLFRGLGLGPGSGSGVMDRLNELTTELKSELTGETPADSTTPADSAPGDRAAKPGEGPAKEPAVCQIELRSGGLTVNGERADVAAAVEVCRRAGKAHVRATGGARVGDYEELIEALERAGVVVDERRSPPGAP